MDWMMVLLILCVFLYHCARFFDQYPWHVKDTVVSPVVVTITGFMIMWMLPAIFVISGAGIWYSLGYQRPLKFIRGKILRLFIPLVFGIFVLSPHQVYLERLTTGQFSGSFFAFIPHYFDGLYGLGGNFAWIGMHLWYLLPLFLFLRSGTGGTVIRALGSFFRIPGTIYLLGLPLAVPMAYISEEAFSA
ncbi:MAG TPA: acyltransferase family protein [Spirochaetia bacterium]|nr:acyltransferase family protein [Spirochaetia bacterium]